MTATTQPSGSAYVFISSGSTWSQQAKLTADDADSFDRFGCSVGIFRDSIAVGAKTDDDDGSSSGSAYVFTRTGNAWSQQDKLVADDAEGSDFFGNAIVISGDSVVVGSFLDNADETNSGSAYVFTRSGDTWSQQTKLTADDAAAQDFFGDSVAISGDTVVIGADFDSDRGEDSGSVYIYRIATPSERKLLARDHLGAELPNASAAAAFPGQLLDTGEKFTFSIANTGSLDLDIQSISLGGADSGEFDLILPNISSPADLSTGESLDFIIIFQPTGLSGTRNATVIITSNDTNIPVFSFSISGLGLSNTTDGDGDGMNDWVEHSLLSFGFDWTKPQPNRVNDYYERSANAGLYTQEQIAAVDLSTSLFKVDPTTNTATFKIELEESNDLGTFTPITADPAKLSVDGEGKIIYELDAPEGTKFFRADLKP